MLVFDGRGYGHGVGLCQTGAAEMAAEHKSAAEILGFYFPVTTVRIAPEDEGWRVTRTVSMTVRSTHSLSATQRKELEQPWREALQLFPLNSPPNPEISFAPSTELFRQLTSRPGWALASTRGKQIVLQPEVVLRRSGAGSRKLLLHEMLHVLVESVASDRAPLWLREGIVEELSGEAAPSVRGMTVREIDTALLTAGTLRESERAHQAAAAHVHALVLRYGISVVRGWLGSGPPSGVV